MTMKNKRAQSPRPTRPCQITAGKKHDDGCFKNAYSKEFGSTNLVPPSWKLKNLSNINTFFGDLYMEEFLRTQTQLSKHMLITLLCGLYFVYILRM